MRQDASVLGKMSVDRFLRNYWQQEPVVIRQAFPGLEDPLTADELAGLACEPSVDSRLVMERGGPKPWTVIRGPQKAKALRKLGPSHWTLLVESVDRHSDPIAAFAHAFSFLPRWRMDDVMVSLAPVHGTVDAHIDSYDVFLIQGQGRRRWEVDRDALAEYRPGLDLRILKRFKAQESWSLDPGDMLYVPPGVGHRGVTVPSDAGIALTYSVGFRAPSSADLLSTALSRAIAQETPNLFSDARRKPVEDVGELSAVDLKSLKAFLRHEIDSADPDEWVVAAGEAVTAGGGGGGTSRVSLEMVRRRLVAGSSLRPMPAARVAWAKLARGRAALFINGESQTLPRDRAFAASFLCGRRSPGAGRRVASTPELLSLAVDLLRAGVVALGDEGRDLPASRRTPRAEGSPH